MTQKKYTTIHGFDEVMDRLNKGLGVHGKVLASSERYKFHNSVKNSKGAVWAAEQLLKDCTEAMEKLKQLGKDAELIDKI